MSKYNELEQRINKIENELHKVKHAASALMIDAAFSVSDKKLDYYAKLQAEHDCYIRAVTEILENQLKEDRSKINAIEVLLNK